MKIIFYILFLLSFLFASIEEEINLGVYFYKHKNYEKALEIFDKLLIEYPNSKRIRLEYARVLFALKKYDEAKKEFLYVLSQNPPPVVAKNIKWFLNQIQKQKKKNFFFGEIGIGGSYDSNIENKSNNPVYGGFVDANPNKRKDNYITAEFSIRHIRKFENNSNWSNTIYIYDEFAHNKKEDKITYINLNTSYNFLAYGIRVSLPLSFAITNIEEKRYLDTISFLPTFIKPLSKKTSFLFKLSYEKNKNKQDPQKNSNVYGIFSKIYWKIRKFKNSIGIGFKQYKKTKGDRIDIDKNREIFDISTTFDILKHNSLSFFYTKIKDTYKQIDPTILDHRVDKLDNLNLSFFQEVYKNRYFSISASKVRNISNIDIFSYEKNIYSFKISQRF